MKIIVLALTKKLEINHIKKMVGVEGFEPPTTWSQTRYATKLRYTPKEVQLYFDNILSQSLIP